MKTRMNLVGFRSSWGAVLPGPLLALGLLAPAKVHAEPGYFVVPSVSVVVLYDDNLFYVTSDQESDLITRVTPAIELGYESPRLTFDGRVSVEAENYRDHSELNSNDIRRLAEVAVELQPSSRLRLDAGADYTKTETPVDLSLVPGGQSQGVLLGRTEAVRRSVHAASHYQFTRTVTGSLAYAHTRDELVGSVRSDTGTLDTDIEHRISSANAVTYGYRYRTYRFKGVTPRSSATSTHTPWLGLEHDFSAATSMVGRAGARFAGDSTEPYLLLALRHQYRAGEILAEYERDEAALLGSGTRQEIETASLTVSRKAGRNMEFRIVPTFAKISSTAGSSKIYGLALEGRYRINKAVSLTFGYGLNYQPAGFAGGATDRLSRNVFQLGITVAYPRPTREEDRWNDYEYRERIEQLGFPGENDN